ncbi:site-specific DNA-methyltransferase [Methylophilus sp. QUAN]|uniref:site-specific DNA-methyltransferase n=1 Tax=Methylophilus sp. QUAN TaxID=2781020 RepID=UPI0018900667|nr:site-specific DNA-methyltransferase [Methylophilus sp. QUAN]MBF4991083.1 site-specific DNA-methyltransferase [Methylophilus sp. QUAN]
MQMHLFDHVAEAFAQRPEFPLATHDLYEQVAKRAGISHADLDVKVKIGQSGQEQNLIKRQVRWHQQTMKKLGLIERVEGERGIWQLTEEGKGKLTKIRNNVAMVAYSTKLGIAIWGNNQTALKNLDEPIMLCLTSPPYPLRKPRAYGNPTAQEYTDFICKSLEPIVKNLHREGSLVINVTNDVFNEGLPSRNLYLEKLVIAINERFNLALMDRWVWHNKSKPPGPLQWASKTRQQLNVAYEPIYWFAVDPLACKSNNRRVLEPHTETHRKYIENGGSKKFASNNDGAYILKPGSYSNITEGRIPRNVLEYSHTDKENRELLKILRHRNWPTHGAMMPGALVLKIIKFLTDKDDLVVDLFSGSSVIPKQAEDSGRRWLSTECMLEYVQGSAVRFAGNSDLVLNEQIFH